MKRFFILKGKVATGNPAVFPIPRIREGYGGQAGVRWFVTISQLLNRL
jgi:hypothetical protein